jgi:hypothetical protein
MLHLFDSNEKRFLNITDISVSPAAKWLLGALFSATISWAGWTTSELILAKQAVSDVSEAIARLDHRFASIDQRLERIETMLMTQGVVNKNARQR